MEISPPPFRALRRQWMEQAMDACERALHAQESQEKLWDETRKLMQLDNLQKIEVYDNSHIQGTNAVGAMIATTKEGFQKNLYRRFNIPCACGRSSLTLTGFFRAVKPAGLP